MIEDRSRPATVTRGGSPKGIFVPNRIIKESICTSDEIDQLTAEQEVLFYRLMVVCDDFGLIDARLPILKSKCYPLKSIDINSIQANLSKLAAVGLVSLYQVEGKPYLSIKNWSKHQQIRAQRAKYPMPKDGVDISCNQLISDAPVIQSNPIQSESNPTLAQAQEKTPSSSEKPDDGFGEFWKAYPRKVGKGAALKAWGKVNGKASTLPAMLAALGWQRKTDQWVKNNGQFIPHPSTWLNEQRWLDEGDNKPAKPVDMKAYEARRRDELAAARAAYLKREEAESVPVVGRAP